MLDLSPGWLEVWTLLLGVLISALNLFRALRRKKL